MAFEQIVLAKDGRVATITLNRPHKLNAYGIKMEVELEQAIADIEQDDDIRAIIITGAGRAFCVGHDLEEALESDSVQGGKIGNVPRLEHYTPLVVQTITKPVIAAINGVVAGGGVALALMCDFRLAAEDVTFVEAHVGRGLVPAAEIWLLPRLVGLGKALELLLVGDRIGSHDAERIGLVNRVVSNERLSQEAHELAAKIAKAPLLALRLVKRATYKGMESDFRSTMDYVASLRALSAQSGEAKAGIAAFVNKKKESS